jgi:hypothetical protein
MKDIRRPAGQKKALITAASAAAANTGSLFKK